MLRELVDTPDLPKDAQTRLQEATSTRKQADVDGSRETAAATELRTKLAELIRAPELLKVQDSIDLLAEQRHVAVQAEADFARVEDEVARHRSDVLQALAHIKPGLTAEEAREAVPAASVRRAVQSMANEHPALMAAADVAKRNLNAGIERRELAEAKLANFPVPSDPALLRATIDRVRGEGRLDADLVKVNTDITHAQARVAAAFRPPKDFSSPRRKSLADAHPDCRPPW